MKVLALVLCLLGAGCSAGRDPPHPSQRDQTPTDVYPPEEPDTSINLGW